MRTASMRAQFGAILVVCLTTFGPAAAGEPSSEGAADAGWGSVSGRVVFEGDPDDDLLEPYRREIGLYDPISIQDSMRGVRPRLRAKVTNECLLIDSKTRGIANAIVYLEKKPERVHPEPTGEPLPTVELICKEHRFEPRIVLLQTGQTLRMSVDPDADSAVNFHSLFVRNPNFNRVAHSKAPGLEYTPKRAEKIPARFDSNLELAAKAWCLVLDHPYAAVSAADDGSFEIENLPAGNHELVVWHETVGYMARSLPIVIEAGKTIELEPQKLTLAKLWQADRR